MSSSQLTLWRDHPRDLDEPPRGLWREPWLWVGDHELARHQLPDKGDDAFARGRIRSGHVVSNADALLHDREIAEEYEALARTEHTIQRALGARAKTRRPIAPARDG